MKLLETDSVQQWLFEMRMVTEPECMCVLQGKPIARDAKTEPFMPSKSVKSSIDNIRNRAHIIGTEFAKLFKKLEKERWRYIKSGSLRITCNIRSLLHECNASIAIPTSDFVTLQQRVMEECARLVQYVESNIEMNGHQPQKQLVLSLLTALGQSFSELVDTSLGWLVQNLLEAMEDGRTALSVTATINSLTTLGLEGEHMCYIIAREGGVKMLFDVCKNEAMQFAHGQALRALATICCVPESILEMDKSGGVECLSDILGDGMASEITRSEAAGVIAQVTSPCLDHYQHIGGFLENMDDLIRALTVLCVEASTHEVFLLGVAALANMTFMDSMACDYLLQYNTARVLIEACHHNKANSLFAKDQVATVMANMAAIETCCNEIVDSNGVELLVQFLQLRPSFCENEAELSACEHVQQKAAIALSRLCRDVENAHAVVELQAIPRLVALCEDPKQRNSSDAVLVACLAALRKISSACGGEDLDLSAMQPLVEAPMMDTFIKCSNVEESYV